MISFCRRYTARSSLSSAALVFVLLLQSVHSEDFSDEDDFFDTLIDGGSAIDIANDTEFPGRGLDIEKAKKKLDQYDRQIILFEHNTHRRTTEPLAADMVFMVWSLRLQQEAKRVAENCSETYELSDYGKHVLEQWFSSYGINTWMDNAMFKFVIGNVVHKWTEEKSFYSFGRNTCRLGKKCSQYIQVIWSKASHVGCELSFCPVFTTTARIKRNNLYYVVCVYGEGEERVDESGSHRPPFTNGTQCDRCPTGFSKCSDGLCQTDPPCETVIECSGIEDTTYCLCDTSVYDGGHRLAALHWTWMGIWFTGAILSSFLIW